MQTQRTEMLIAVDVADYCAQFSCERRVSIRLGAFGAYERGKAARTLAKRVNSATATFADRFHLVKRATSVCHSNLSLIRSGGWRTHFGPHNGRANWKRVSRAICSRRESALSQILNAVVESHSLLFNNYGDKSIFNAPPEDSGIRHERAATKRTNLGRRIRFDFLRSDFRCFVHASLVQTNLINMS